MLSFNIIGRGTYLRAYKLAVELIRLGHEVTLIGTKANGLGKVDEYTDNKVLIVSFPDIFSGALRSGWDPYNSIRRLLWLRDKQYDIVHAFESRPTVLYPALYLKRKGAALVMDWCDWFGRGALTGQRSAPATS